MSSKKLLIISLLLVSGFQIKFIYCGGGDSFGGALAGSMIGGITTAALTQPHGSRDSGSSKAATDVEILRSELLRLNDKVNEINSKADRLADKVTEGVGGLGLSKSDKRTISNLKKDMESALDDISSIKDDQDRLQRQVKDLSTKVKKMEKEMKKTEESKDIENNESSEIKGREKEEAKESRKVAEKTVPVKKVTVEKK